MKLLQEGKLRSKGFQLARLKQGQRIWSRFLTIFKLPDSNKQGEVNFYASIYLPGPGDARDAYMSHALCTAFCKLPLSCTQQGDILLMYMNYHLFLFRVAAIDSNVSGISENGRLSCRSSSGSLDTMTDSGAGVAELSNGTEETEWGGSQTPVESKRFVNNNDSQKTKTQLEIVNNRERTLKTEAQLKFVNSNIEGMGMENLFREEGDELD